MNKKTLMVIGVTAVVVIVLYPRLRSLPGVNKLPTL
jgi:hypothetical protein